MVTIVGRIPMQRIVTTPMQPFKNSVTHAVSRSLVKCKFCFSPFHFYSARVHFVLANAMCVSIAIDAIML